MENLSLYEQSLHSVVVSRLVLHPIGPGFKSRLSRFFHWEYKLQCKIFDITILLFMFLCKSPWSSGLQDSFASNRFQVQIPDEQIFSIESINFNVRFLILQFCLWYFFLSFLRLCQPNLSLLYIPFLMSYCSTNTPILFAQLYSEGR